MFTNIYFLTSPAVAGVPCFARAGDLLSKVALNALGVNATATINNLALVNADTLSIFVIFTTVAMVTPTLVTVGTVGLELTFSVDRVAISFQCRVGRVARVDEPLT